MFHGLAVGWADLVLPATSSLERDGTLLNLEGRLQRLRRAVIAPVPDELAWIAQARRALRRRALAPRRRRLRRALGARVRRRRRLGAERHRRPARSGRRTTAPRRGDRATRARSQPKPADEHFLGELRLVRYRPLFSGPVVERVDELAVPAAAGRARARRPPMPPSATIANGDTVVVRSNGTSVELRARINREARRRASPACPTSTPPTST